MPPPPGPEKRKRNSPISDSAENASIGCPDCGTIQILPPHRLGVTVKCWRCRAVLERTAGRSIDAALACSIAALLLLVPANVFPLLSLSVIGIYRQSHLASGAALLWSHGWAILAAGVVIQGICLPFVHFALLTAALAGIRLGHNPPWLGPVFRWACALDAWAMADVYLLGCAIGYERIDPYVPVAIRAGGWALIGAAFMTMMSRAALDRRTAWRRIQAPAAVPAEGSFGCRACDLVLPASAEGGRCPRCRAKAWRRRPHAVMNAAALVAAGYLFYLPANYFPLDVNYILGHVKQYRIIDGVRELFADHLYPLGVLIFLTSIAFPLMKLVAMTWFLLSVKRSWTRRLVTKSRTYRLISEIGRWSNADIFTITVFMPLMQFHSAIGTTAGKGAPALLAVVVLTMFAERVFDPRLMWDQKAGGR